MKSCDIFIDLWLLARGSVVVSVHSSSKKCQYSRHSAVSVVSCPDTACPWPHCYGPYTVTLPTAPALVSSVCDVLCGHFPAETDTAVATVAWPALTQCLTLHSGHIDKSKLAIDLILDWQLASLLPGPGLQCPVSTSAVFCHYHQYSSSSNYSVILDNILVH